MTGILQTGYVFLSYRTLEREFATTLGRDLLNAGVGVWLDVLDTGIQAGDDWPRRLEEAIDQCAGFVCVLSPDYVHSEYCLRELSRADKRGVPIIPLLLRPLRDSKAPIELERTQHIDFERWQDQTFYERQYSRLEAELRRKLSPVFGSKPDRETRYLNDLTAELGKAMGVLEYTELGTQVVNTGVRPRPWSEDEWGYSVLGEGSTERANEKSEYVSIAQILQKHPQFVLIGAPGAGKSTTLRRLVRDAAFARRERPRSSPLPLLLNLAQWPTALNLREFVRACWPLESDPADAIRGGDVSIFLDGLNEMGGASVRNAAQLREWLQSPDGPKTIVVTCRANEYEGTLALANLPTVLVNELQPQQIVLFVRRYLQDEADAFLRQLGIDHNGYASYDRGLLALARNPYFLCSLIELFILSGSEQLPHNSGVLLDRLTQALWQRERLRRTRGLVPLATLRSRCAGLALAIMDERKSLQIPIEYAVRHVTRWFEFAWRRRTANKLFHSAASAGLISIDTAGVRFSHQLVQEYFAALSFIDPSGEAQMAELEKRRPASWLNQMNTFIALCGLVKAPESLVRLAFGWGVRYAAQCLASGISVSRELRDKIVAALIAVISQRPLSATGYEEGNAAEALGLIGDIGAEGTIALGDLLLQGKFLSRDSATRALSRLGTKAAALELHGAIGKMQLHDRLLSEVADDYVINRMSEMGAIAVPELIGTLEQTRAEHDFQKQQPRPSTVRALQQVGRPAVPALLETLRSGSTPAKAGSAEVLGRLKVVEAVPLLVDALATPDSVWSHLHNACLEAFTAIGDAAIPHLKADLISPSTERRVAGVRAMGAIGTAASIPFLLSALQDGVATVRDAAVSQLSTIGAPAVAPLLEFLNSASQVDVAAAAKTLGFIKDTRALPVLQTLLTDADHSVRSNAAFALGNIADGRVTSALLPLLQDEKPEVTVTAAWSLGELKDVSAVGALIRCLAESRDEKVRMRVALSLEKIASQPALAAAMQYWREILSVSYDATEAGEALGRMHDATAIPLLIQAMRQGPEFARSHYINALGLIGDSSAVPAIIERLHDRDTSSEDPMGIVASAIEALARMRDIRAVEPLTELLTVTDTSPPEGRICDLAAKALQNIGAAESIARAGAHWRAALADANVNIRLLAAETLATFKYEPATEQLISALSDQEETVYYNQKKVADFAAAALELIGSPPALAAVRAYWRSELTSERTRGRVLAILGLGRIRDDESQTQLIALLKDSYSYENRYVADYAADLLKASPSPSREARLALAGYSDWRQKRAGR